MKDLAVRLRRKQKSETGFFFMFDFKPCPVWVEVGPRVYKTAIEGMRLFWGETLPGIAPCVWARRYRGEKDYWLYICPCPFESRYEHLYLCIDRLYQYVGEWPMYFWLDW